MGRVSVNSLKIGDVLGRDIISKKGIVILKKGTVLDEKLINSIKNLGFSGGAAEKSFIFLEKEQANTEEDIRQKDEYISKEIALLEERFERVRGNKLMDEVKEFIKAVITEQDGII